MGVFETLYVPRRPGLSGRAASVAAHLMDLPELDLPHWRHAIDVAAQRWIVTIVLFCIILFMKVRCD